MSWPADRTSSVAWSRAAIPHPVDGRHHRPRFARAGSLGGLGSRRGGRGGVPGAMLGFGGCGGRALASLTACSKARSLSGGVLAIQAAWMRTRVSFSSSRRARSARECLVIQTPSSRARKGVPCLNCTGCERQSNKNAPFGPRYSRMTVIPATGCGWSIDASAAGASSREIVRPMRRSGRSSPAAMRSIIAG